MAKARDNVASSVAREIMALVTDYATWARRPDERPIFWANKNRVYAGNTVKPLIHGDTYFGELLAAIRQARKRIYVTGWAVGPRFPLQRAERKRAEENENGVRFGYVLGRAAQDANVDARVLVWLNFFRMVNYDAAHYRQFFPEEKVVIREVLSTVMHQKTVTIDGNVAFCGGIDITALGGDHWDTCDHTNKPAAGGGEPLQRFLPSMKKDAKYWHDVQLRLEGPAVSAIETNFAERWSDEWRLNDPVSPPTADANSSGRGRTSVQIIRTIPPRTDSHIDTPLDGSPDPDAWQSREPGAGRDGMGSRQEEYSVLESYGRAIINARRFVYIENQYFTCAFLIDLLKQRLAQVPELSLIVVIPRESELAYPGEDLKPRRGKAFSRQIAQEPVVTAEAVAELRQVGGDRVLVVSPINKAGEDIYVHAKVMIVDDIYATVGSANFSQRSMFIDLELGVAWMDGEGSTIRDFRGALWSEHLGLKPEELKDPEPGKKSMAEWWRTRMADPEWKSPRIVEWSPARQAKR